MKRYFNKIKTHLVVPSLGFAVLFWVFDIYVDVFVFKEGTVKAHFLSPEPFEIYYRTMVVLMFIAFGFFAQRLAEKRKKAEKNLKVTEDKYKIVAENTYDWEFWTGPDSKFIYTSPSSIRITGYSPQKFNEDSEFLVSIIHADDLPAYELHRKEAELIHGLHEMEFRIHHADGSVRWISHACQPVTGTNGEYLGIRGTNRDITERKKIEAELKANEKKYRDLFSSMRNGFALHRIIVDQNGRSIDYEFLEINDAFERMTGLLRKDTIGRHVSVVMPELKNDPFDWVGTYGRVALYNEQLQFEQYAQPLGKWYNITAYSPAKGQFATIFEDITERKNIERLIRENQERMNTIFGSIQTGIMVIDRETHRIIYVNQAAAGMIGADLNQLTDKPCQKFICPADIGDCPITDKGLKVDNSERILLTADGRQVPIIKTVMETELEGHPVLVESFVDISERKIAEQQLQEKKDTLTAITDSAQDAIIMMDSDGKISFWNPAAERILGYDYQEALGKNLHRLIAPEKQLKGHLKAFPDFQRTGKGNAVGKNIEMQAIRKDGKEIEVELSLSAVKVGGDWNSVGLIRDITERKQIEGVLRASEEKFRLIAENTADTITVMDLDLKITYISPSIIKLRGYTAEEAMIQSLDQIILPDYLQKINNIFEEQMALETSGQADPNRTVAIELEEYRKDGSAFWAEVTMSFLRDNTHKPMGIVSITRDITERKQAEERLKESETQKRLILQSMPVAVYTSKIDQETDATWISGNVDDLTGFSAEEFLSEPDFWRKRLHPDDRDRVLEAFKDAAVSGLGEVEYLWRHRDGHYKWFQDRFIVNQADGRPEFLGVISDVTQRKLYEKEIEKATSKIKLLLDSAGEGIYGLDDQGKTIFINQAGAQLFGYQPEEMLGRVQHELTHHTKPDGSLYKMSDCPIHASFIDGNVHNVTGEVFWRKDGSNFPVEYISTPIKEEGKINGSVVVFRDVTERKQAEALQAAIYKISEISSSADNLLELYAGIHMIIDEMMSTVNFYMAMYNEKEGVLEFPYFVDERDPSPGARPLKKGLTEYVLRTGKALLAPPMVQKMLAKNGGVEIVGTPSIDWMGVPLNMGKTTLGVLVVQSYREEVRFGARELAMLTFISDNIAAAISRKKSEEERKKSEKLQDALYHISEAAAQSDNLEALYGEIHKVVAELTSTKNFYLAIYNEKEQLLSFPYSVDEFDPRPQSRKLGHGLTEYVLNTGVSLLADREMQQLLAEQGKTSVVGTPAIEWAGVPLKVGGRIMGVLVIQSYREDVRFGTEALSMLNFVSDNIALAISRKNDEEERKKLIRELQASLDNIKTLKGLVPICSSCKKIRNDKGYWQQVEEYVSEHTEADFSHGICDECAHRLYPQYFKDKKNKTKGDEVG